MTELQWKFVALVQTFLFIRREHPTILCRGVEIHEKAMRVKDCCLYAGAPLWRKAEQFCLFEMSELPDPGWIQLEV